MLLTGAEIIVEVLIEQGVTDIFGYPGGAALDIYDALYKRKDRINHYMTAHEQGAAHAADGYARATGKTGVVLSTSGPGATNLVTGIATAYLDSIPMVAITANVGTPLIGKDSFQEVFITGITDPITKHNYAVRDITRLAHTLRTAFRIAQSGRKGPVLIDIPKDISNMTCEFTPERPIAPDVNPSPKAELIAEAAELINKAKRPVVCFGGGVVNGGATKEVLEFLRKANIPACHTLMATGVIGYGDAHDLGMLGMHGTFAANKAVAEADLLIAMGTRFNDRVAQNTNKFSPKAKIVQLDIDPSENSKNVAAACFISGDIKEAIKGLTDASQHIERDEWFAAIKEWRERDYFPKKVAGVLRPHDIMQVIADETKGNAIIATDVGQHQMWASQYCHEIRPRGFLTSGGLGTMGFGYGAAIGAKVGVPDAKVIHVTGDGSFHMNMHEACTAVSNNLQVVTVIFDNRVLGMVHQWQQSFYGGRYMCTEPERKTDYVKVIEGFGGKGFRAETVEDLRAALKEALNTDGPTWIACPIDMYEKVLPMIPPGKTVKEIIADENI